MGLEQHESKYKITEFSFWGESPFKILFQTIGSSIQLWNHFKGYFKLILFKKSISFVNVRCQNFYFLLEFDQINPFS